MGINMSKKYQRCINCVMDTTDSSITFDKNGVCSHCHWYKKRKIGQLPYDNLLAQVKDIKTKQAYAKYDVVVGISGGIDSSYVL